MPPTRGFARIHPRWAPKGSDGARGDRRGSRRARVGSRPFPPDCGTVLPQPVGRRLIAIVAHAVGMPDYVIVGAGPAGCVLANRLSADPGADVLLVEAGGPDTNPLIAMPRGFGELLGDPAVAWHYPTRPFGPLQQVEYWVRGKTLGGSSAVNGMVYNRGQAADYEPLGPLGWGWDEIGPAFEEIEDNGLRVSTAEGSDPLLEDVITAGTELGWQRTRDFNATDDERIAYATATIHDGRRVTAADAFLHPADRPAQPDRRAGHGRRPGAAERGRAVGVRGRGGFEAYAAREVILAAGSIATPGILERSGIGAAEVLRSAGIDVVVDSPNVGGRMREHRAFMLQFRLAEDLGYNRPLSNGAAAEAVRGEPDRAAGGAVVRHRRVLQIPPGARPSRRADPGRAVLDAAARTRPAGPARARAGDALRRLPPAARQRGRRARHLARS